MSGYVFSFIHVMRIRVNMRIRSFVVCLVLALFVRAPRVCIVHSSVIQVRGSNLMERLVDSVVVVAHSKRIDTTRPWPIAIVHTHHVVVNSIATRPYRW